jgi:hypothetical protein
LDKSLGYGYCDRCSMNLASKQASTYHFTRERHLEIKGEEKM